MVAALIYPHQLFEQHPALESADAVYLLEDPLFFGSDSEWPLRLHIQKLLLHRCSIEKFAVVLKGKSSVPVTILRDASVNHSSLLLEKLPSDVTELRVVDVVDDVLSSRIEAFTHQRGMKVHWLDSPMFLSPRSWLESYGESRRGKKPSMAHFYQAQRLRMDLLVDHSGQPEGGRWSFDEDNRKKLPRGLDLPSDPLVSVTSLSEEECQRIVLELEQEGYDFWGEAKIFCFPVTHVAARKWLEKFLLNRFRNFGTYEDALSTRGTVLFHSVLSPMLNIGLLDPSYVVKRSLEIAKKLGVELNNLEGFLRQIVGWREFVRLMYERQGRKTRSANFFGFTNPIPKTIYEGNTGIFPVDHVVAGLRKHAYSHHIERLMVMGNFFVLLKIHPDQVYRWFMEMYIDAYDWVMVPNVYGMSQFSDGGSFVTKPYISGSNYLRKMSDYPKGAWCEAWDSLFWSFVDENREFFASQYRMKIMLSHLQRMGADSLAEHHQRAGDVRNCLQSGRPWSEGSLL